MVRVGGRLTPPLINPTPHPDQRFHWPWLPPSTLSPCLVTCEYIPIPPFISPHCDWLTPHPSAGLVTNDADYFSNEYILPTTLPDSPHARVQDCSPKSLPVFGPPDGAAGNPGYPFRNSAAAPPRCACPPPQGRPRGGGEGS